MRTVNNRWRDPGWYAAVVNAALFVLVPFVWLTYADYTGAGARPALRTLPASAVYALRSLLILFPISFFIGWRTYAHARGYCTGATSVWRGPLESTALAGGIALTIMLTGTARAWFTHPPASVALYIALYVVATAIIGLLLGVMLACAALAVLWVGRAVSGPQPRIDIRAET